MLNHDAPSHCKDSKGRTPLHYAAKAGANIDIAELKEKGNADINTQDNKGKTPLFNARDYKTVLQLLKYGADPRKKADNTASGIDVSALEYLMQKNEESSEAILDRCLTLEKNSNLVMNFEIFKEDDDDDGDGIDKSFLQTCTKILSDDSQVLKHPLIQNYFLSKATTTWPIVTFIMSVYSMLVVPATLTSAGVIYSMHTSCVNTTDISNSTIPHCFRTKYDPLKIDFCHNKSAQFSTSYSGKRFDFVCSHGVINFTDSEILSSGKSDLIHAWDRSSLYLWTAVVLLIYFIKEVYELFVMRWKYFEFVENYYAWILLVIATVFMVMSNFFPYYANSVVGWLVFITWFETFLFMGNNDIYFNLGDYSYMSIQVAKPALVCLIAHVPIFLAFTFGFDIMLQSNPHFDVQYGNGFFGGFLGFFGALIKVMSMMFEPTYEVNFSYDAVEKYGGQQVSSKIMAMLFIGLVPLIVVNMLIAVSVSNTDLKGMTEQSRLMRTKRKINDLNSLILLSKWERFESLLTPLEKKVTGIF